MHQRCNLWRRPACKGGSDGHRWRALVETPAPSLSLIKLVSVDVLAIGSTCLSHGMAMLNPIRATCTVLHHCTPCTLGGRSSTPIPIAVPERLCRANPAHGLSWPGRRAWRWSRHHRPSAPPGRGTLSPCIFVIIYIIHITFPCLTESVWWGVLCMFTRMPATTAVHVTGAAGDTVMIEDRGGQPCIITKAGSL